VEAVDFRFHRSKTANIPSQSGAGGTERLRRLQEDVRQPSAAAAAAAVASRDCPSCTPETVVIADVDEGRTGVIRILAADGGSCRPAGVFNLRKSPTYRSKTTSGFFLYV